MLSISGFDSEIITGFFLSKKIYCHSHCTFQVNICSKSPDNFLRRLGKDITITISGRYIFCGYITEISAEKYFSHTDIIVRAVSYSLRHDQKPEKRIFQNPQKTLSSIITFLGKTGNLDPIMEDRTPIEYPVLQCDETDFAFIIRMAQTYKKSVFVHDDEKSSKVQLTIGTTLDEPPIKITNWEKLAYTETYDTNSGFHGQNHRIIELILRDQYIRLGQKIILENQTKYVAEAEIFKENNILKYRYKLYDLDKIPPFEIKKFPEQLTLKAITTDNYDNEFKGRIKVSFDYKDSVSNKPICDYSDIEPGEQTWIPYHTPYLSENGGFIFLPDKGDFVEIIYSQNNFTAYGIHGQIPLKENFHIPGNKYIANIFGKQIIFKENQLEIRANDNTIILSDKDISFNVKDNKLVLNDKMFAIEIGKTRISIDDNIAINTCSLQTDTFSEILLKSNNITEEATKSITVEARHDNIKITGKQIYLNRGKS